MVTPMKSMKLPALLAAALLFVAAPAFAAEPASAPAATQSLDEVKRLNLESFDVVWQTVRDQHFDPKLNGVDWDAARAEYRPRVAAADSADDARALTQEMIEGLGDSHMDVIPGEAYTAFTGEDDDAADKADGQPGFHVRLAPAKTDSSDAASAPSTRPAEAVLVVAVDPGSGAEKAGVQTGWEVVSIDAKPVAKSLDALRDALAARGHGKLDMLASFTIQRRLGGEVGSTLPVVFRDGDGRERKLDVPLEAPTGEVTRLGALPPMRVDFQSRRIERDGVTLGYIAWNAFLNPPKTMAKFSEAMADFRGGDGKSPVDGVVLDVRGNVGGIVLMCPGIAGYFLDTGGQKLGTLKTRDSEIKLVVYPRAGTYDGPLAVLTDACSVSAAELLSGGLQAVGRARVIGTPTAGEALPAMVKRLPNGDGFLFVFADYHNANGQRLEGDGVQPDEVVSYDRADLLKGVDPMLAAAAEWVAAVKDGTAPMPDFAADDAAGAVSAPTIVPRRRGSNRRRLTYFAVTPRVRPVYAPAASQFPLTDFPMKMTPKRPALSRLTLAAAAVAVLAVSPIFAQDKPTTKPADGMKMDAKMQGEMPSAKDVLAKYVKATGGEAAYAKLTGQKATGTFGIPSQSIEGGLELYQKAPDKMLAVVTIPGLGKIERAVNGDMAWQVDDMQGPHLLGDDERKSMLRDADPQSTIHPDKYYSNIEVKGKEDVAGKPAWHLTFTPKDGGKPTESFYDVDSGLLVKTISTESTPQGEIRSETTLSDYREVGTGDMKMMQPFKISSNGGGVETVMTLKTVELNADVPATRFDAPEDIKKMAKDQPSGEKM